MNTAFSLITKVNTTIKLSLKVFFLLNLGFLNEVKAQELPDASKSSAEELAKKLANPVASLISVPFQNNLDYGVGPYKGSRYIVNVQPVIPIKLNDRLNLITRYIVPIIDQRNITSANSSEFGIGDATVSGFFSPSSSKNGLTWGAGPAILVPTGTNNYLSSKKWGLGPTALILKQSKGLTYGFLVNQIWSIAGHEDRTDINQMFLQPFFVHNWKSGAGLGVNAEITANWQANTTIGFLNPNISGVTKLGKQTVSLAVGPRIPLFAPENAKTDFGFRASLTFVFPQ